jgi:glycosyltransferase involved in cell wall biosynthesis
MTPLRIAVDARELLGSRTGVGRYLGELMNRWALRPDAARREFHLYAPEPLDVTWPGVTVHVLPGGRGTWWEQTALRRAMRRHPPDVFFAPAYTAPLRISAPLVVTIHDISFSRHPEWFRWREGTRRHLITRAAARRAACVLTVSEFSKREIHDLYGIPAERIRVIPSGLPQPRPSSHITREPIVLYVGSVFNRRHVPDLIAAFAQVARSIDGARLVIAGDNRSWPREDLQGIAAAHGVADRVDLRSFVSDEELMSLFARASAFAFLSEYEGLGLTPLEALMFGVPGVVLDTPVAREVYRDAVLYVNKGDVPATAGALRSLLTEPAVGRALLDRAPAVLPRFSWDRAADEILPIFEAAARR